MDKNKKKHMKLQKEHRKKLIDIAKSGGDWDYSFLHIYVCQSIKNMYEFYSEPNNCMQCEDERLKTLKSLEVAINIIKEIEHSFSEYYIKYPAVDFENMQKYNIKELNSLFEECLQKENSAFLKLYTYIGEHMKEWWD